MKNYPSGQFEFRQNNKKMYFFFFIFRIAFLINFACTFLQAASFSSNYY